MNRATGLIAKKDIELLTFGTPNGFKISILLEELKEAYGIDYKYQTIDIFHGVQREPWFIELSPNGRIPIVIDHEKGGYAVMETLAILNYLTRHYDPEHKFSFKDPLDVCTAEQWIAWQHAGLGPTQAQANFYFRFSTERHAYPTQRYVSETERLYGVLNTRLAKRDYIVGSGRGKYSIADIAFWPFIHAAAVAGIELEKFQHVYKWWTRISQRPAVRRGLTIPSGEEFPYSYDTIQRLKEEDPQEMERQEAPLREALKSAQKDFGSVFEGP